MSRIGSAGRFLNMASTGNSGGDLMLKAPDGRSWQDVIQGQSPNQRVADAFSQIPAEKAASPVDRIRAAFEAMRAGQKPPTVIGDTADANGVYGPNAVMLPGGPGAPMNLASHGVVNVPDRVPPAPPQDPQSNPIGFFLRNALAQRDQESGNYLNPTVGTQAMASPFKGLFG